MISKKIIFRNVSVSFHNKKILDNINWQINACEHWAVLGLNGAGKTTLLRSLFEDWSISGNKTFSYQIDEIGYVSFDLEKKFRYSPLHHNATKLHFNKSQNQNLSTLSTGEIKKFLLHRALAKKPKLLILDEPLDGLDESSRVEFVALITKILKKTQLILITHRFDEIPKQINHVLVLKDGKVYANGNRKIILNQKKVKELFSHKQIISAGINIRKNIKIPKELIRMKNVSVKYGKRIILKKLNWTMKYGENWAILGPNGAGKTTFLKLITGDNQQSYSQDIKIFGIQKGSGESVWEIKKHISEVSGDLQIKYQRNISTLEVVISGFFDSIGIYEKVSKKQLNEAKKWLINLGLEKFADLNFANLSQGEQRMIILARAMVKSPLLLILDEPTNGLDIKNRKKILELINWIGKNTQTHLIFVTHHKNELPSCIKNTLNLNKYKSHK